jgi:hypothetical protein
MPKKNPKDELIEIRVNKGGEQINHQHDLRVKKEE